jgi:hypothetical protein
MSPSTERDVERVRQSTKSYDDREQAAMRAKWAELVADRVAELDLAAEFVEAGRSPIEADDEGSAAARRADSFTERMA